MFKLLIFNVFLAFSAQEKETIISDTLHDMEVELNPQTVLCLIGDYGATSFKIAVQEINDITYLDHTSPGAPGPCINAGYCQDSNGLLTEKDFRFPIFHDISKPKEKIQIRLVRKEVNQVMGTQCVRRYIEELSSTIRGTQFFHLASLPLATLNSNQCQ